MKNTMTRLLLPIFGIALVTIASSRPAWAISLSVGPTANNTKVSLTGGGSSDRAQGNQLQVPNAGNFTADVPAAIVTGQTRFIATVAADRGVAISGGTANATDNVDYTVQFTVTPDFLSTVYMVNIATNILGAATQIDDNLGVGNGGTATMTNVAGSLNAVNDAGLALASSASQGGTSSTSGAATQFSANNLLVLGPFSGPQNFTLRFTWNMTATSPQAANGGDEAAVRIGFDNPHGGNSADNYPGVGSRTLANDGHFVNMSAEVLFVPEPSTLALAGMGLFGLALLARRRKAA